MLLFVITVIIYVMICHMGPFLCVEGGGYMGKGGGEPRDIFPNYWTKGIFWKKKLRFQYKTWSLFWKMKMSRHTKGGPLSQNDTLGRKVKNRSKKCHVLFEFFVRYKQEFVITVIGSTEFDSMSSRILFRP